MSALDALFRPRSVAIIGASIDQTRIGGRPIHGMRIAGFAGDVFPVNPRYAEIGGYRCYPDLAAIPGPVDLALVALPAAQMPSIVAQCASKGVGAMTIFTSGFAELGADGAVAELAILNTARAAGIRVLGPNCMGTMNPTLGFIGTFTSTVGDTAPLAGHISIASQSGAFGAHLFALLRRAGVGMDLWATTGNQADIEIADCIEYMAASPGTRVIAACIEGVRDGARFEQALATATANGKAVVVLKLGRSPIGAAAATSHTAALAGSDAVFDAVLRKHGALRADTVDDLIDFACALGTGKRAATRTIGIASVSGGFGVLMADAAAAEKLTLPELPEKTQQRLRERIPFGATRNPLDFTAQFINQPDLVEPMLDAVLSDTNLAAVVLYLGAAGEVPALMDRLCPGFERIARRHPDRIIALCLLAPLALRARLQNAGFLIFEDPTRAIRALAALCAHGARPAPEPADARAAPALALAPFELPDADFSQPRNEFEAKQVLRSVGIVAVEGRVARSPDEAVAAAVATGFPVVMKILSTAITHKSDVGGVRLDLADEAAVTAAYRRLRADVRATADIECDEVLIEPMIASTGAVEIIIGVQRDPVFGPVVMVGLGGIHVESLRDVSMRLCPVTPAEAEAMLRELKGFALLAGGRGEPLDVPAAADAVSRLSRLASAHAGAIDSIDVNPYLLMKRGGIALDAVIVPRHADRTIHDKRNTADEE